MTTQEKRLAREISRLRNSRNAHWCQGAISSLERRQAALLRNKRR